MRCLKPEALLTHAGFLRNLARSLVYDENEADDLVQGTYLAALEGSSGPRRELRGWLAGITRNLARMTWRGESRRRRREHAAARPDGTVSAADTAARMEEQERLVGVVARLEEPYRTAVVLRYLDGLPPREIATRLDVPVRTVETRLRRALEKLRARLDESYRGDRRRWMAAFLPLIHPTGGASRGSGVAAGAVLKAASVAALVLAICWVGWHVAADPSPAPVVPEEPSAVVMPPPTVEPEVDEPGEATEEPEPEEPPDEEEPVREAPPPIVEDEPAGPAAPEPDESEPPDEPVRVPAPPIVDVEKPREPVPPEPVPGPKLWTGREPPGMACVEGGKFEMGMPERVFEGTTILRREDEAGREMALFEVPEHEVEVETFWMDLYEVTNAQYLAFLDDAHKTHFEVEGNLNTLVAIATQLHGAANADQWKAVYHANWKRINPEKKDAALVDEYPGGLPAESWGTRELKEGTLLAIHDLPIPAHWLDHGTVPPGLEKHPVTGVTWHHACLFAAWAGKHLPTEIEWERAARGPKNTIRPWGGTWEKDDWKQNEDRLNWGQLDPSHSARSANPAILTTPVGSFPEGVSGYGMFDMLGNVWEWTDDTLHAYPGSSLEPEDWWDAAKVIRGGGYGNTKKLLRTTFRTGGNGRDLIFRAKDAMSVVGFRCARWTTPGADRAYLTWRALEMDMRLPKERSRTVEFDRFGGIGVEAVRYDEGENAAFVTGGCRSIAILPRARLDASLVKSLNTLAKKARGGHGVVVGLLHTDVALRVWKSKIPEKAGEPVTEIAATAAPGDYVLAYRDGRLLLLEPKLMGLEPVGHITDNRKREELGDLATLEKADGGSSEVVAGLDEARITFPVATRSGGRRSFVFRAVIETAQPKVLTMDWRWSARK
jgi:RNA polymerase sigma factor (sigma-70 family)